MDRQGAGGARQKRRPVGVKGLGVTRFQTAGPAAVIVILVIERAVVTARQNRQRTIVHVGVGEVTADGEHVVIGVREELDVLMPFDHVAGVEPFEIQFRMVEQHIRPGQVGGDIGHQALSEPPIGGMLIVGPFNPAQYRRVRAMAGADIENSARLRLAPAVFDELGGDVDQFSYRLGGHQALDTDIAMGEIMFALGLRESTGRLR